MKHKSIYVCPKCGIKQTRVIDTQTFSNGVVKRTRRCFHCGVTFVTKETPTGIVSESVRDDQTVKVLRSDEIESENYEKN
jgi:transcriptional regulator NrdR family protein